MKTTIKTRPFDAAEYLNSEESIAAFVGDALESGDIEIMLNAINTAARARGMAQIAEASGLGRESLYKALRADAKPRFDTIMKVLSAVGVKLVVEPLPPTGRFMMMTAGATKARNLARHMQPRAPELKRTLVLKGGEVISKSASGRVLDREPLGAVKKKQAKKRKPALKA
ncbi:addiction module antidote protein [Lysobacter gummosus]|uniref:addiction module antidote protein n=2 Tax=Lysobacter gummosus TaxID=262324 RepID=UPI003629FB3A